MGEPAISQAAAAALISEHLTRYRVNLPVLGQSKGMSFGGGIWGDYSSETGTSEEVGKVKSRRVTWAYGAGPAWMGTTNAPWEPLTGVGFLGNVESIPGRPIWMQFFDNNGPFPPHSCERISAVFVIDGRQDYAATFPLIPGGAGKNRTATVDVSGAFLNFMFGWLANQGTPELGVPLTLPYLQSLYRRKADTTYQKDAPEYGNNAYFVPPHMPDYYPTAWVSPPGTSNVGAMIQQWFDNVLVTAKAVPISGGRGYMPDTKQLWAFEKSAFRDPHPAFFTTYVPPPDITSAVVAFFGAAFVGVLTLGLGAIVGGIAGALVKMGVSAENAKIDADAAGKVLKGEAAQKLLSSPWALQASIQLAQRFPVGSTYSDTVPAAGGIDGKDLLVLGAVAAKVGGLL